MWIRTATKDDLAAVRNLLIETWHSTFDASLGANKVKAMTERLHSPDALKKLLSKPYSEFILADDGDDILGMAFADQPDYKFAELRQLCVRPDKQGQGVGSLLLIEIESSFPNAQNLRLEVVEGNTAAIGFYESRNYIRTGRVQNWGEPNSGISVLKYEKPLLGYAL
ncbi:MAG: GNAT family N-acetyltransferase [Phyllobacterium sp.]